MLLLMTGAPLSAREPISKLISTPALDSILGAENLRIIDVRESIKDYWQSHIPGAVYLSPEAIRFSDGGVPVKLMPHEALTILLGKMGIDNRTVVIAYSEQSDFRAAYLIWALDYLGHTAALLLDGGFQKWQRENRRTTQDYPPIAGSKYPPVSRTRSEVRADMALVKRVVDHGGGIILDVRANELYRGEAGAWKRRGHIKGSLNHFWGDDLREDGTWKSKDTLKTMYEQLGITEAENIIVSCGQGQMSAHTYFALKYILGYMRVKNYDGSFNEWSNVDSLPVGTAPDF